MWDIIDIIDGIHAGLIGEIFPSLRAIGVNWNECLITIYYYFDGSISDEDNFSASCISNEIIARYCTGQCNIDEKMLRLDEPQVIPRHMLIGYMRKEKYRSFKGSKINNQEFDKFGENIYPKVVYSINQALLNQVTPELRKINIDWSEDNIYPYFYYYSLSYDQSAHRAIISNFMEYFPNYQLKLEVHESNSFEFVPHRQVCGYMAREMEPKEEDDNF